MRKIQNGYIENKLHCNNPISLVDGVASLVHEKETLDVICLDTDFQINYSLTLKSKLRRHSPDRIRNKFKTLLKTTYQ